jgi:3-hydroxyacyl-[acyl-carrier-protein] dehydratase
MLLNDFYKTIKTDYSKDNPDSFQVRIELNDKHKIFKGHFPGNPVVPGVCMIQIVKEILSKSFKKNLHLSEGSNIKFTSVIKPEINRFLNIDYKIKQKNDVFRVNAVISFEERIFFKFKGKFRNGMVE